ncbi:helix-turn-helix transcriptional regulator [Paeniglutamicibacter antarcticus]|uniref:Helix-turn-helix transcriptional regulator n=1 Tax=Arthrobacter terrae TaxID=2935737 RepID=A0A931CMN8_9MICC|nr:helix-turn-helix domain-containing protein [Arthrobacter terrae]MBG0741063.1 helix-turn-helix transcriptional regulator [Arthrobacter terrae]
MKSIASIDSVEGLGATVRRVRKRQDITQMELARMAGVSRSFIIELEDGHPRAELGKVLIVLNALEISLAALTPEPATKRRVNPNCSVHVLKSTSDAPKDAEDTLSRYRIQYSISLQRRAREQRARTMADITRGWSEGRSLPDQETQQIVIAYIEGVLSLDEAMSKVQRLSVTRR